MSAPPIRYTTAPDGVRIAYMRRPGASPPFFVVYTPGTPSLAMKVNHPGYVQFWDEFARERGWVLFDWRGTGASDRVTGMLTNDDLADDVVAVLDVVGEPVDMVMVGRGCYTGTAAMARRPGSYRSLWILPQAVRFNLADERLSRPGWEQNPQLHFEDISISLVPGRTRKEAREISAVWVQEVPPETLAAYHGAARGADMGEALAGVACPAWVTNAPGARPGIERETAALLKDAVVTTAPNRGGINDWAREDWDGYLGSRLGEAGRSAAPSPNGIGTLTGRELEVLVRLAGGDTNAEVAGHLGLAEKTIARHVANIYAKIGAHNRVEAANWAREHGVV